MIERSRTQPHAFVCQGSQECGNLSNSLWLPFQLTNRMDVIIKMLIIREVAATYVEVYGILQSGIVAGVEIRSC